MEKDLGEGQFSFCYCCVVFNDVFSLLLLLSSITYFQVDFTISGLTCPDASIAFDTDFG